MSDQIRRNDMTAAERLDQIEARANEATEGPWVTGATPLAGEVYFGTAVDPDDTTEPGVMLGVTGTTENAAFIAHARTDVPWLIEQVRKRDAALRAVLDLIEERGAQAREALPPSLAALVILSHQFNVRASDVIRAIEEALS